MTAFHRTPQEPRGYVIVHGYKFVRAMERALDKKGRVHFKTRTNSYGDPLYSLPGGQVTDLEGVKTYARQLKFKLGEGNQ